MENKHRNRSMLFFLSVLLLWGLLQMVQVAISGFTLPVPRVREYTVPENSGIGFEVEASIGGSTNLVGYHLRYTFVEEDAISAHNLFAIDPLSGRITTLENFPDADTVTYSDTAKQRFYLNIKATECLDGTDCIGEANQGGFFTGFAELSIKITKPPPEPTPNPTPEPTPTRSSRRLGVR